MSGPPDQDATGVSGPGPSDPPTLRELAAAFVVQGNFTYGGGSATIATLHHEIVDKRRWLTEEPFQLSYALSRLTPGTNLLAFSACIGYLLRRSRGALVTLLAGSIPCAAMAFALTALYSFWSRNAFVHVAIHGALAAAIAVVFMTGVTLIRPHWRTASRARIAVFVVGSFTAVEFLGLSPLQVLLLAALGGGVWTVRNQT